MQFRCNVTIITPISSFKIYPFKNGFSKKSKWKLSILQALLSLEREKQIVLLFQHKIFATLTTHGHRTEIASCANDSMEWTDFHARIIFAPRRHHLSFLCCYSLFPLKFVSMYVWEWDDAHGQTFPKQNNKIFVSERESSKQFWDRARFFKHELNIFFFMPCACDLFIVAELQYMLVVQCIVTKHKGLHTRSEPDDDEEEDWWKKRRKKQSGRVSCECAVESKSVLNSRRKANWTRRKQSLTPSVDSKTISHLFPLHFPIGLLTANTLKTMRKTRRWGVRSGKFPKMVNSEKHHKFGQQHRRTLFDTRKPFWALTDALVRNELESNCAMQNSIRNKASSEKKSACRFCVVYVFKFIDTHTVARNHFSLLHARDKHRISFVLWVKNMPPMMARVYNIFDGKILESCCFRVQILRIGKRNANAPRRTQKNKIGTCCNFFTRQCFS